SQKAGELDLERSSSPELSSKKQNKLDKNRPDYKNSTYFVNGLRPFQSGMVFFYAILQRAFIFLESAATAETRLKMKLLNFVTRLLPKCRFLSIEQSSVSVLI
ncbi:hypothetical protein PVN24_18905, partial [Bacillus paralicheniformis]|uniref:hypothetical protein n=2 Tax=Bacillus TaxID=1386 RepID=UPI001C0E3212